MTSSRHAILLSAFCAFLVLFFLGARAFAGPGQQHSAETIFQQGNELYEQGKYPEALQLYRQIIAEDGFSGPLLYNLANCYAQTGRTGLAILNYERALRLSPGDSDVRGNLDLLRKNQGIFQEERPLAQRAAAVLDFDQWTLLAGVSFMFLTFINLAGLRFSNGRRVQRWLGGLCLLLMVVAATGAFYQYRQLDEAVVIGKDTRLLLSPFPAASSVETIQEGRKVYATAQHGTYSLVEDETGHSGWIETKSVSAITLSGNRAGF